MRLDRDEFFGHEKILKLINKIAKKSREQMNRLNVKDEDTRKVLIENKEWLDYVGIIVIIKDENTVTIKWEIQ